MARFLTAARHCFPYLLIRIRPYIECFADFGGLRLCEGLCKLFQGQGSTLESTKYLKKMEVLISYPGIALEHNDFSALWSSNILI